MQEKQWKRPSFRFLFRRDPASSAYKSIVAEHPQKITTPLDGAQPYVKDMPQGCPFSCSRCSWYREECKGEIPMVEAGYGSIRCIHCVCKTEIPPVGDITI